MAPKLVEIGKIEELSASETPTVEGAWWIMLQTAESICNCASLRDPVNNNYMVEFWSDAATDVEKFIEQEGNRPLPYDDLMEMVSFCGDQLQDIIKAPRHNLVKVDKMVRPEKAREIGYKTINWLGKQPGKTVREKMAGKQKMLTQVKEYSYDIKENQIALMLYHQIMRRVAERINRGIKAGAYDDSDNDQMNQMKKMKKLLRESVLSGVTARNHTQANNALLSDKNYSVIWRAYMDMSRFDTRLENRWNQGLELYVKAFFLALNAGLLSYEDVYVVEERVKLNGIKKLHASYIVGYHYRIPYIVELTGENMSVTVSVYDSPLYGSSKPDEVLEFRISFSDSVSRDKLEARRGTPLSVEIQEDKSSRQTVEFADLSCIRNLLAVCVEKIFSFADIEPQKIEKDEFVENGFTASTAFDIVSNGQMLGVDAADRPTLSGFYSPKAVAYMNADKSSTVYPCGQRSAHIGADEHIAVRDAVTAENSTGLKAVLDEIHEKLTLGQDDYFFYLVPDALEEFLQKDLKQCVKGCFSRTFPVWRSVAALGAWLMKPEYQFEEDSLFIYMDLVGDTATAGIMTIHYEDVLENYACNHFPPFPQIDAGDNITEDAFCRNYVLAYAEKYGFDISDETVSKLVESGQVKDLMRGTEYANYFYEEKNCIGLYQITFDEELVKQCVSSWLEDIRKFWVEEKKRIPGGRKADYVYFISDLLVQYVNEDELRNVFTIDEWNNLGGIFQSNLQDLLRGALVYKDRLNNHLPIWTEYLPKLSLKIPIQGKYVDWDLIDQEMSIDVMQEDNEFSVKEQRPLRLHAGVREYHFELKKEDISRKSALIEACIPLKEELASDLDVRLFVRYKYGYDNSYELILRPVDAKNAPFEELIAEWRSGYRENKSVGGPAFPVLKNSAEVVNTISFIQKMMMKNSYLIRKFLTYYYNKDYTEENLDFEKLSRNLTRNTFAIRDSLRYYDMIPEVRDFTEWFYDSDLYMYCRDFMLDGAPMEISAEFFDDYAGTNELKNLQSSALQLMYSFGCYVPDEVQNYLVSNYGELEVNYKQSMLLSLVYMNSDNDAVWFTLLDLLKRKPFCISNNIRSISNLLWCDEQLIFKFGEYPALVRKLVDTAVQELKSRKNTDPADSKFESYRKRYLAFIEVILAVLRLRANPDFNILTAGMKEAKDLAELIRKVDDIMGNPESRIKLLVDKPDALIKMSDIAYAIDMYLTGNEGVDSIEVLSVESDE